jgi:hypothetical protein
MNNLALIGVCPNAFTFCLDMIKQKYLKYLLIVSRTFIAG